MRARKLLRGPIAALRGARNPDVPQPTSWLLRRVRRALKPRATVSRVFLKWVIPVLLLPSALLAEDPPSAIAVTALPADIKARYEQEVLAVSSSAKERVSRLLKFMFEQDGLALVYDNERTRTVAEVVHEGKANCLSFTLTFIELARLAGLNARMIEREQALISFVDDKSIFFASHVSAQLRIAQTRFEISFDPNAPMQQSQSKVASAERGLAHYYNNRAAELMADGELLMARLYFDTALNIDPSVVSALNNSGVLNRRMGNPVAAEKMFKAALRLERRNLAALSNLIALQRSRGQDAEADVLQRLLTKAQRRNPLHHFVVGVHHERQGELLLAREDFEQAARLDRDEILFQQALTRVNTALGDTEQARRHQRQVELLGKRGPRTLSSARQSRRR